MWKYVGIVVLVGLIAAGAVFLVMRYNDRTEVAVTVAGIKEIAQLSTVEYVTSSVTKYTKPKE